MTCAGRIRSRIDAFLYPSLAPGTTWLRQAAVVFDRVRVFDHPTAPPIPDELAKLDQELGGVLLPTDVRDDRHALHHIVELIAEKPQMFQQRAERELAVFDWKFAKDVLRHLRSVPGLIIEDSGEEELQPLIGESVILPGQEIEYGMMSTGARVVVNAEVFELYVALVASGSYGAVPVTDRPDLAASVRAGEVALATIDITAPQVADAEPGQIAELREETATARHRFARVIDQFVRDEGEDVSVDTLAQLAAESFEAHETAARASRVQRLVQPITVAFAPGAVFQVLAQLTGLGVLSAVGLGTAAVAFGATSVAANRADDAAMQLSPWTLITEARTAL